VDLDWELDAVCDRAFVSTCNSINERLGATLNDPVVRSTDLLISVVERLRSAVPATDLSQREIGAEMGIGILERARKHTTPGMRRCGSRVRGCEGARKYPRGTFGASFNKFEAVTREKWPI